MAGSAVQKSAEGTVELRGRTRSLLEFLPKGLSLPEDVWNRRHRWFVRLLWLHAAALGAFAALSGHRLWQSLAVTAVVALFALLGGVDLGSRRLRASLVSFGYATASGLLVHLSGGYIEMHFHYFVMVTFLVLYQDWVPFLISVAFVGLQHGVMGVMMPHSVFNHPDAVAHPWKWATIHAAFLSAASIGSLVAWRTIERTVEQLKQAILEQRQAEEASRAKTEELVTVQRESEAIRRLNEQLEASNRELEAFSYSISHDLRAPLRHIDGFADLLQKHTAATADEKGRRYLGTISQSAKQMGLLIDNLLAFSRIGRAELSRTTVNLNKLLKDVVQSMRQDLDGRRIAWTIASLPSVFGDQAMLRQVLVNLVGNAVKYTGPREEARIEVGSQNGTPGEVVIFVRDNGVGFDMKYADKLFGVFQRLHSASEFEGTGIGLANVQRIVRRHGGRVWGEGVVDAGATFYVSLPQSGGPAS